MVDKKVLVPQLIIDEGLRLKPYVDTVGKITIGIGINLTDTGITKTESIYLCSNRIDIAVSELQANLSYFNNLPDKVQLVLVNMAYNMGTPTLLTFRKALAFIEKGDYDLAGGEMLVSKWATQVGDRAVRLSNILKSAI